MASYDGTLTSETWCYGVDNTTCCNSDSAINIPAQFGKQAASATTGIPTATNTIFPHPHPLIPSQVAPKRVLVLMSPWVPFRHICILDSTIAPAAEQDWWIQYSGGDSRVWVPGIRHGSESRPEPGEMNGQGMAHEKAAGAEDTRHELHAEPRLLRWCWAHKYMEWW